MSKLGYYPSVKQWQNSGKTLALTKEDTMIEEYRREIIRRVNETTDERELYLIMICARSIAK